MYAEDEAGNRGNVSNVVVVRMPKPDHVVPPNPNPSVDDEVDWVMIGIAAGVVATLIIIMLIGLYLYFFMVRRKHQVCGICSFLISAIC